MSEHDADRRPILAGPSTDADVAFLEREDAFWSRPENKILTTARSLEEFQRLIAAREAAMGGSGEGVTDDGSSGDVAGDSPE